MDEGIAAAVLANVDYGQESAEGRTNKISTTSDTAKEVRKIKVHILSVVKQKGQGYTVAAQVRPDPDITSEEIWRAALPGAFRGATKMDRLWHLYYGQDPEYLPGALISITLPEISSH